MGKDLMTEGSLFNRLWDAFDAPFAAAGAGGFKVDVKDNGDAYELTADLPGMKQEDISLNYENDYLTLSAKREDKVDEKDDNGNYIRRERSYGKMERSFYITGIDKEHAKAEFKDGVLKVALPKLQVRADVSHQIPISTAG